MTTRILPRREFVGLTGAMLTASALGVSARAQTASAPLAFGYQATSWGTIGMICEGQNLFKEAGANVTTYKFDGGKTTRDAMISGRVDVGVLGSTPFVVGAAKGDMVAIGMCMYAGKADAIVAGNKSGIKTIADLKGRRVASQLGSATDYVFQEKILPAFGLKRSDVQIINIPHQNHIAALIAGSVDAFAGVEPFPSLAEVDGVGHVLVDYEKYDMLPVIIAANRNVVEHKRAAVVALLRGWLQGVKLFRTQRPEAEKIVFSFFEKRGFSVSLAVIKRMLSKLDVTPTFKPELPAYLDVQAKLLMARNVIARPPDWSKVLMNDLMTEAMKS